MMSHFRWTCMWWPQDVIDDIYWATRGFGWDGGLQNGCKLPNWIFMYFLAVWIVIVRWIQMITAG